MSAYLKFFELEQSPFEGRAQSQVVLGTRALREAFASIRSGLEENAARICVSGGAGLGKTSLARALPKLLGEEARVAVVLDPDVSWESLRGSIAKQWGLATGGLARSGLIEAARDRRLVLVIDRAESASEEFLDHLDVVLSYRNEREEPVVQSILFAKLSGSGQREAAPIVWWLDRIQTLQLEFAPLPRDGVESYIQKHLKRAGWRGDRLFSSEAALAIHGYTGGIPGQVSKLCERLLSEAAARDRLEIDAAFVHSLCDARDDDEPESEDHFEELVFAEAFEDAGARSAEPPTIELVEPADALERAPTLEQTLEHFQRNQESTDDESCEESEADALVDPSGNALERILSAPASLDELRAIRRSLYTRHGRAFAAAMIAAVIGGIAFAWLAGDADPVESPAADDLAQVAEAPIEGGRPGSIRRAAAAPARIARLRGPVTSAESAPRAPVTPAAPSPRVIAAETQEDGLDLAADDPDLWEEISEDDLVDLRPAAMLPGATEKTLSQD